ncbi:UDP-2,4-diacetamido-2,4,6-trideoxy-beta-L-altropyranosyl transferase [Campylobacter iguaniorum]|uniref:UDP-2,4-diacetamido-2,4, 6-trideoxy-beta-L-altropyranosyl transferase n=1 Tax=Campylobacter iguaniorum TaxID=1244531 RepID=A0A076FAU4_9BACT|nr:UDP-2,4-diacetamido-2,4,6-trideoxy-beta-L-altropyranose hydrolase [Campylobacter iguaniorum]AII15325.1 UDP-2,4-diacetamido-2,4,6-trideoxy-beta-L-altropyranosyl transferase [Campylobacter iguaniorum]ALV25255.1 UDP-2,4-diacetamido-2,4,6-trideoxy-beta-L-altropyranosyl transferase [Campylobacter iguaniorum]
MKILLYANGGECIGLGHIMRMLVLCDSLKMFDVCFVSDNKIEYQTGHHIVEKCGFNLIKINNLSDIFVLKADFLIVDSYDVPASFFTEIKTKFKKVMCIDDECELEFYDVDYIFNQNLYARQLDYKISKRTKLIFDYCSLRDEFFNTQKIKINENIKNIFLTLGGSDDNNLTKKIIVNLQKFLEDNGITLNVAITNAFKFKDEVRSLQNTFIKCHDNADMSKLMSMCDIGICGLGQTTYEFLCLGVPIIGITLAKNQENLAKFGVEMGMLVNAKDDEILRILQNLNYQKRLAIRENINSKFNIHRTSELDFNKIFY